jgi:hypothetical protein
MRVTSTRSTSAPRVSSIASMRSWESGRGVAAPSTAMRIEVASCAPIQIGRIHPSPGSSSMGFSRMTCWPD